MIMLETDCNMCRHVEVCMYKNNAKNAMEKLKNAIYGSGYNNDYDWDTMMRADNVVIKFSCPKFTKMAFREDVNEKRKEKRNESADY